MKAVKQFFSLFIKGVFVGAVDVLPGVSGGTIALAFGIYNDLIHSIHQFNIKSLGFILNKDFKTFWNQSNGNFLLPFFSGVLIGIFVLARTIEWLFDHYSVFLWSFFWGLLVFSIYYLIKQIKFSIKIFLHLFFAAGLSFGISCIGPIDGSSHYLYLFLCGAIGIVAMVLPGISGALILIILGVYPLLIERVNHFSMYFLQFNNPLFNDSLLVLSIFLAGVLVGLKIFVRLLDYLFQRYQSSSYAVLVGIIIGVLYKIWPWQNHPTDHELTGRLHQLAWPHQYQDQAHLLGAIILFILGLSIMVLLKKTGFISFKTTNAS
ncbi:MAG: DUF368 domain-containing protein [Flavobacteriaceae bacterium]|nr:DUF368 domain-containing protein [Flavobacteriaceae bacterium]MCY4268088.1 DUF368 domain-containing protein [Flavobacteriaceae bacterium]MCY4298574.1 DUF368 domain-containing protein [Flavobacteriaceae bacterium]